MRKRGAPAIWQHQCNSCQASEILLKIDHVQPRCQGGSDRVANLVLAYRPSHESRGASSIEVFLAGQPEVPMCVQSRSPLPPHDAAAVKSTR
jgi:hypothetical protein